LEELNENAERKVKKANYESVFQIEKDNYKYGQRF